MLYLIKQKRKVSAGRTEAVQGCKGDGQQDSRTAGRTDGNKDSRTAGNKGKYLKRIIRINMGTEQNDFIL
jgi:hypothetical protein